MNKDSKIYVAGHNGMVGSAIIRKLKKEGYNNIVFKSSSELNLINQIEVEQFMEKEKPEYVFLAAAKVGGIMANNTYKGQFIYENLMIQNNIIHQSYLNGVKKLLFLGSSCIYPKNSEQPIKEEYLLSGYLEKTNEPYALAKIAGVKMCDFYREQYGCNFISTMPTNLYGPNDNYDINNSHVLPALLMKFHKAKEENLKEVEIWGSGEPLREFLHVDDLASACLFLMYNYDNTGHINVGSGKEISIKNLALLIKDIVNYKGDIYFNKYQPDGTMRKLIDSSKINKMGWKSKIELKEGITEVYRNKFLI